MGFRRPRLFSHDGSARFSPARRPRTSAWLVVANAWVCAFLLMSPAWGAADCCCLAKPARHSSISAPPAVSGCCPHCDVASAATHSVAGHAPTTPGNCLHCLVRANTQPAEPVRGAIVSLGDRQSATLAIPVDMDAAVSSGVTAGRLLTDFRRPLPPVQARFCRWVI